MASRAYPRRIKILKNEICNVCFAFYQGCYGTARTWGHGDPRHGTAIHGTARHGAARHGTARHGPRPTAHGPRHGPWDVPWDVPWHVPWDVPWDVPWHVPWDVPWEFRGFAPGSAAALDKWLVQKSLNL